MKNHHVRRIGAFLTISLLVSLTAGLGRAQETTGLPLFSSADTLHVQIEGPLTTLIRKRSNTDYYGGKFRYREADGSERELSLKFRTRGNYRRRRDTCRFPPVRLNFAKKEVVGTEFEGQNILKLVTHCRPRSNIYEQFAVKEYLAYKILELHTPYSFRTRLMKISWIDTDKDNKVDERYGFVIEHKNEVAARLGGEVAEVTSTSYDVLNPEQASIASVFQYMIGNTDFSMIKGTPDDGCCHNGILVNTNDVGQVSIPYDFDFSGLVNAPYAEPNPRFKISKVTTRLYRGNCRFTDQVDASVALFLDERDAVMRLIDEQDGLTNSTRSRAAAFIERFYQDISNPRRVQTKFVKGCS